MRTTQGDDTALPHPATLTPDQVRGAHCVWCGSLLRPETVVDLGPRQDPRATHIATWWPRACGDCAGRRAREADDEGTASEGAPGTGTAGAGAGGARGGRGAGHDGALSA
ncbi:MULTISPECIES: hypothetical protein [Streptomyces]|uniref:HNH endonuclease n=1 Tax=Streptomyces evansiae TaxID=3075535 RepID=A0ABU2RBS6_9ACTN|nr:MULTISPECIES: hypothetical protein [unclassified Streptomyces]MDT0412784.1 hypothetical protein [Streptomyces sp. DSM 41979]SCE59118.1 hypothetical protein GA0115252_17492 [Streptomyces sp. DfronAA-171]